MHSNEEWCVYPLLLHSLRIYLSLPVKLCITDGTLNSFWRKDLWTTGIRHPGASESTPEASTRHRNSCLSLSSLNQFHISLICFCCDAILKTGNKKVLPRFDIFIQDEFYPWLIQHCTHQLGLNCSPWRQHQFNCIKHTQLKLVYI